MSTKMAYELSVPHWPYHDRALEKDGDGLQDPSVTPGVKSNFPVRLHYLISEAEKDGMSHIITWMPHGRCFAILKPKEFVEKLLPLWFDQTKLESFHRQINIYGFTRISSGPDKGCYYHEYFLRGKAFLAYRIPRGTGKSTKKLRSGGACADPAPNFYGMPFLPTTTASAQSTESTTNRSSDLLEGATTRNKALLRNTLRSSIALTDQFTPSGLGPSSLKVGPLLASSTVSAVGWRSLAATSVNRGAEYRPFLQQPQQPNTLPRMLMQAQWPTPSPSTIALLEMLAAAQSDCSRMLHRQNKTK